MALYGILYRYYRYYVKKYLDKEKGEYDDYSIVLYAIDQQRDESSKLQWPMPELIQGAIFEDYITVDKRNIIIEYKFERNIALWVF
jgi:hypothetical protein